MIGKPVRRPENMHVGIAGAGWGNEGRLCRGRMRGRWIFHNKNRNFGTTGFKAYRRSSGKAWISEDRVYAGLPQAQGTPTNTDARIFKKTGGAGTCVSHFYSRYACSAVAASIPRSTASFTALAALSGWSFFPETYRNGQLPPNATITKNRMN